MFICLLVLLLSSAPVWALELHGYASQDRPAWLPASAYTSDDMIGPLLKSDRTCMVSGEPMRFVRSRNWPGKQWRGKKVDVRRVAGQPGWFTFETIGHPDGPRGWYECLYTRDKKGYLLYRIWLDR